MLEKYEVLYEPSLFYLFIFIYLLFFIYFYYESVVI